jgi:hypothetical protein
MKHLKHTLETCVVRPSSERRKADWGTTGSDQPVAKDGGATWQRPAAPLLAAWPHAVASSCAALSERGGEGGRWPLALGCGGDRGRRRARGRRRGRRLERRGEEWGSVVGAGIAAQRAIGREEENYVRCF